MRRAWFLVARLASGGSGKRRRVLNSCALSEMEDLDNDDGN